MLGISEGSALVDLRPPQSAGSDAHAPGALEPQLSQLVPASPTAGAARKASNKQHKQLAKVYQSELSLGILYRHRLTGRVLSSSASSRLGCRLQTMPPPIACAPSLMTQSPCRTCRLRAGSFP
eukprot:422810-Alexandrium_andersonii.AAC.1